MKVVYINCSRDAVHFSDFSKPSIPVTWLFHNKPPLRGHGEKSKTMYYEISNVVFNHKLTEWEISHRNPFSAHTGRGKNRTRQNFFLVKDTPERLFKVYQAGHCIKPHAFNLERERPETAFVNCIILDFDNLTEAQFIRVREIVNSRNDIKGDYSSGMKTTLYANMDIEGWKPEKWKFKVFYPVENCLSTYEDIDAKFREAVAYFNGKTIEETEPIWRAWRKANNRKNMITDKMFKDWILPDVAMANNARNQITYAVEPSNSEKVKVIEDEWMYRHLPVAGAGKYNPTSKWGYNGLEWKLKEGKPEAKPRKPTDESIKECAKIILSNIHFPYDRFNLPISKAGFSRLLKKNHFDDLIVGSTSLSIMLAKMFKKQHESPDLTIRMDDMMKDASLCGKAFARILAEIRNQGLTTSMKEQALQDIIRAFKEIHGQTIFETLSSDDTIQIASEMSRSFMSAWMNYTNWRKEQRLMKVDVDPKLIEARNRWRDTHDEADMVEFFKLRAKDIERRWNEAADHKYDSPYDYHRRGFKTEVFNILLNGEVKIETPEEFIQRLRMDIVPSSDGEFSDKFLGRWFVNYKTIWNKTFPDNPISRKKTKWGELFNGKSNHEISETIKNLKVSRMMKTKLRRRYLKDEV